jgi:peptidase E
MVRLYFLGGENVAKRDAKEINASAFSDAGNSPAVTVIPWARPSFDVGFKRRKRLTEYFRSLGASRVSFLEFSDSVEDIAINLSGSDLVYLTGGQVSTLLSRLRRRSLDKLLHSYRGVVVGRSAGAVALGKNCIVTNRYSGRRKVIVGLGQTDFTMKAHYEPSEDYLLKEMSKIEKIYAVPTRAALVYDNGSLSFIGKVLLFENGQKTLPGN